MSFKSLDRLRKTTGFRLTVWYSGLFMLSALALFALAYALLWSSLRQTDQESIALELHELAALYHDSGPEGVTREIELQRRLNGTQAFFIRLMGRYKGGTEPRLMNMAHVHLLLNHVPVLGSLAGVALLSIAWAMKSDIPREASL
jgi:hypothetical protein